MKIVHISDTHGKHATLNIPKCDVLIHSGDLGLDNTTLLEFMSFLEWFDRQPAEVKIFIGGNHDNILDKFEVQKLRDQNSFALAHLAETNYANAIDLVSTYNIVYLYNNSYSYEGLTFYGSPYSITYHPNKWAFNANIGEEINAVWNKIPDNVNILITHTPPYNTLDTYYKDWEPISLGCHSLYATTIRRLSKLKLHCFGHVHENYGVLFKKHSFNQQILYSNGAVVTTDYKPLITKPVIINI